MENKETLNLKETLSLKERIILIVSILMVVLIIVMAITSIVILYNDAKKTDAIVDGALEDMNLNRSDFKIIELKIFEGTNVFALRLDEKLLLGSFDEQEDGIYVDVIKEI